MIHTPTRTTELFRLALALILPIALISTTTLVAPPAEAATLWKAAKTWSAQVQKQAIRAAKLSLSIAKGVLSSAIADLADAKADLAAAEKAGATAAGIIKAIDAVENAESALVKAVVAFGQAKVVLSAAAVANGATVIGEVADFGLHFCWDPICNLNAVSPNYVFPTDGEIDAIYGSLSSDLEMAGYESSPAELLAHDAVIPGSGTTMLEYMRATIRVNVIALRGAAAFSAGGLCGDVLLAAGDLQLAVQQLGNAAEAMGLLLASLQTYTDDPQPDLDALTLSLADMQAVVGEFSDPVLAQQAIDNTTAAVADMEAALAALSTPGGAPLPFHGGPDALVPPLTLTEFNDFLTDVATNGEVALPLTEVDSADALLALLEINFVGEPSIGPELANYVGAGDLANEASLFTPDLLLSDSLITSKSFRWNEIDLCESPLVMACGGPPCASSVPATEDHARWLLVAGLLFLGFGLLSLASQRNLT